MTFWKHLICSVVVAGSLYTSAVAAESPMESLRTNITHTLSVLEEDNLQTKFEASQEDRILSELRQMFDFQAFSRGALGASWRRFSPEQKAEFSDLFAQIAARAYLSKLDNQSIQDFQIEYLQETMLKTTRSGKKRADVTTTIEYNGQSVPVAYRMFNTNEAGWKVYDVRIEGISMVANYRKQYQQRFHSKPSELIEELRQKLNQ